MKKEETYKNNKKEEKDKKPKEKKYASTKEALKGISEELIQKHKSASPLCWRCGRCNHSTTECYAKTAESGDTLEKPTISSQNKRKRNNDDQESKDTKKAKTAAVRAEPEEQQEKWIWEIDTDSEEDFYSCSDKTLPNGQALVRYRKDAGPRNHVLRPRIQSESV
jgi:hypothetical protein